MKTPVRLYQFEVHINHYIIPFIYTKASLHSQTNINRPSNPHGLTVRLAVWDANSRSSGTTTHGTSKSTNKVKNTLKQIICHFCLYLTHIFYVSRFEVLISRFFWAFFFKTSRFGWKAVLILTKSLDFHHGILGLAHDSCGNNLENFSVNAAADPDFQPRRGPGSILLAQPASLPSVISPFFTQNKVGAQDPRAPPLDPPLKCEVFSPTMPT